MPSVLKKVMQLRPTIFEFIADNPRHEKTYGFIAQEVENIFPEAISVLAGKLDSSGNGLLNRHGISFNTLTSLAIKAIQEQEHQIIEQGEEIKVLKKEIDDMKILLAKKGLN